MQILILIQERYTVKTLAALFLLLGTVAIHANIIDPSASLAIPPVSPGTVPMPVAAPSRAVAEENEEFSVPLDEIHATAEFAGSRLLTGTKEGKWSAFTIERKGETFEVVELGQRELAWQLSKVVISWSVVAAFLFSALFAIADKSRRAISRPK